MPLAFRARILAVSFIPSMAYNVHSELICGHGYITPDGLEGAIYQSPSDFLHLRCRLTSAFLLSLLKMELPSSQESQAMATQHKSSV